MFGLVCLIVLCGFATRNRSRSFLLAWFGWLFGWLVGGHQIFAIVSYQDELIRHAYKDALASRLIAEIVRDATDYRLTRERLRPSDLRVPPNDPIYVPAG